MSFLTGVYPDLLKIVKVIPTHEGSSTQDINNHRPISLLSIFNIEKPLHKRLHNFLEEHNILHHNQFGFRKNNSTINVLTQTTETTKESTENRKYDCGTPTNPRKAFDTEP